MIIFIKKCNLKVTHHPLTSIPKFVDGLENGGAYGSYAYQINTNDFFISIIIIYFTMPQWEFRRYD